MSEYITNEHVIAFLVFLSFIIALYALYLEGKIKRLNGIIEVYEMTVENLRFVKGIERKLHQSLPVLENADMYDDIYFNESDDSKD